MRGREWGENGDGRRRERGGWEKWRVGMGGRGRRKDGKRGDEVRKRDGGRKRERE